MKTNYTFRAWSRKWNKMIYDGQSNDGSTYSFSFNVNSRQVWLDCICDDCPIFLIKSPIYDRNGNHVFEGDIILDTLTKCQYEIKFGFCKKLGFTGFYCESEDGRIVALNNSDDKPFNSSIEVKGNIYEN